MKKIIHNLRKQPEEIRRHILHITTLVFACLLFIVWIYSLGSSFSEKDTQVKIKNDLGPLSTLKDNLVNGFKSVWGNSLGNQ